MRFLRKMMAAFRIALEAIVGNPARGVLTTLGIVIGILAVSTTMTAANGLANSFRESAAVLGSDVLYISPRPWIQMGDGMDFRNRPRITLKEADDLARRFTATAVVNPSANTSRPVRFGSETADNIPVIGTTERQMLVSSGVPEFGRFLSALDVRSSKRVCIIGSEVLERLFDGVDPLNKTLRIGRHDFRVVGVMEKQGSAGFFGGPNFDSQIFVPITTFTKAFGGANRDFNIAVKAVTGTPADEFRYELIGEMRKLRRLTPAEKDNFSINNMESLVAAFNNVMGVIVLIGLIITGISLFVGGVGVMNVMFVSVTERTREIGIRKAIGATRAEILVQFLFEACLICLLGGAMGVGLSLLVAEVIDRLLMPASVSLPIVGAALAVSVVIGVASGLIPAFRAARMRPIEALHHE